MCALALAGRADLLIAADKGYNASELEQHGIEVVTPDVLLLRALQADPGGVSEVLAAQAAVWAGGRRVEELLDALARAQAIEFVAAVRRSED